MEVLPAAAFADGSLPEAKVPTPHPLRRDKASTAIPAKRFAETKGDRRRQDIETSSSSRWLRIRAQSCGLLESRTTIATCFHDKQVLYGIVRSNMFRLLELEA
jgi:hypothetical protein